MMAAWREEPAPSGFDPEPLATFEMSEDTVGTLFHEQGQRPHHRFHRTNESTMPERSTRYVIS
jgi:hypothetical protein